MHHIIFYIFSIGGFNNWGRSSSVDGRFACIEHILGCTFLSLSANWFNTSQLTKYGAFNIGARASQNLSLPLAVDHKLSSAGRCWSLQSRGKSLAAGWIQRNNANRFSSLLSSVICPMWSLRLYSNAIDPNFTDCLNGAVVKSRDEHAYFKIFDTHMKLQQKKGNKKNYPANASSLQILCSPFYRMCSVQGKQTYNYLQT